MSNKNTVKVFIGSGEASLLERKVLIYSLRKSTDRDLDIRVFNGTHNSIERDGFPPQPVDMPLWIKYQNITEFSNYRFLIPQICNFSGRAIWLDSDTICLTDIGELFDAPMNGFDCLAKASAYKEAEKKEWGLSVALFDCDKCKFDIEKYFNEIKMGLYSYSDLHQMTPRFLAVHPFAVGPLNPKWNEFDFYDSTTKLIHYTNLNTQPWKYRSHPYGDLWFQYFEEAYKSGFITDADIELTIVRAYARFDIHDGNRWTFTKYLRRFAKEFLSELRCVKAKF